MIILPVSESNHIADNAKLVEMLPVEDKTGFIRNPAMGWVLYLDTQVDGMENAEKYWEKQKNCIDKASIFYLRIEWSRLEPEEGIYAWKNDSNYINLIKGALDRGLKLAFRVYIDSMHATQQATPDWVRLAGADGYYEYCKDTDLNLWNPYVHDKIFQQKLESFLTAFAIEYDNPDITDFVDGNGLGWWGESHHLEYLDDTQKEEVYEWITDVYSKKLKRVLLGDQYQGDSFTYELRTRVGIRKKGYMIRRDSLGSPIWFKKSEKDEILSHWPEIPVYAENCYHHFVTNPGWWSSDGFSTLRDCLVSVIEDAKEIHANTLDLRIPEDANKWISEYPDLVEDFAINGGYRFVPVSVKYPELAGKTKGLTIIHTWKNTAVGKLPSNLPNWNFKYKVAFALLETNSREVKYLAIDMAEPSEWIKGRDYSYITSIHLDRVSEGEYLLAFAIVDRDKRWSPAINPAVKDMKCINGWYEAGTIEIRSSLNNNF